MSRDANCERSTPQQMCQVVYYVYYITLIVLIMFMTAIKFVLVMNIILTMQMAHLEGVLLDLVALLLDPLAVYPRVLMQLLIHIGLPRPPPLSQQLQHHCNV